MTLGVRRRAFAPLRHSSCGGVIILAMQRRHPRGLAPIVARSVYRSLMRLTAKGAHPEVVPFRVLPDVPAALHASSDSAREFVRQAFVATASLSPSPSSARDEDWSDPFVLLRHASVLKQALRPTSLPDALPVLAEYGRCLLPGEACRFVLHDADDLLLVQRAAAGDGRFVHLAKDQGRAARSLDGEDSVGFAAAAGRKEAAIGSVISIQSAKELPYGRLVLDCVAGPRCRIPNGRVHPSFDVTPQLYLDESPACNQDAGATESLRRELAARLLQPTCAEVLRIVGMVPPVHCAERLSLFLCALLLHGDDVDRRLAVMATQSTRRRLEFCRVAMDAAEWGLLKEETAAASRETHAAKAAETSADVQGGMPQPTRYVLYETGSQFYTGSSQLRELRLAPDQMSAKNLQ